MEGATRAQGGLELSVLGSGDAGKGLGGGGRGGTEWRPHAANTRSQAREEQALRTRANVWDAKAGKASGSPLRLTFAWPVLTFPCSGSVRGELA